MKRFAPLLIALMGFVAQSLQTDAHTIFSDNIKSLQVTVNGDWMSMPVMRMGTNDHLYIGFDELSHDYHRMKYRIEHLEIDGSVSEEIFESDYLEGMNDLLIDDYVKSINTNMLYTHYAISLPNERCRLKLSGTYRLRVFNEDSDDECVLEAFFHVVEPLMNVGLSVDTNTDIDYNGEHQQVSMVVNYNNLRVTNPDEQIFTLVMQNGNNNLPDIRKNVRPNLRNDRGLEWSHNKELIFKAGNEYRKFEILDVDRNAMGVERMRWDGQLFNAWLYVDEPRPNYLTDKDADGAFLIRNSDNSETDYTCEYIKVHFTLKSPMQDFCPVINGAWTNDHNSSQYNMEWDEEAKLWHTTILLKQGYYSYQYLLPQSATGHYTPLPSEGNFFQTENRYQALVYYKETGARTWRLVGYQQVTIN